MTYLNNKGYAPIFLISLILVLGFIFLEPIKNSYNVLSERIFLKNENSKTKVRSAKQFQDNNTSINATNYEKPSNITGVNKSEKSYSYLDNLNNIPENVIPIFPENFNKNSAHIVFYTNKDCLFEKSTRNEKSQKLGNSQFTVYDNVQIVNGPKEFNQKFYKVLAQTSGRKLVGGLEKCGVLIFGNNENLSGKISTKYPLEYNEVAIKDNTRLNKKIHLVIYEPIVNEKPIYEYYNWNNPRTITPQIISFFKKVSGGTLNYSIVKTTVIKDFPVKLYGKDYSERQGAGGSNPFKYNPETYKSCMSDNSKCLPDEVDYKKIVDSMKACEDRNKGVIDELWVWGGPYFGFYESHLVGKYDDTYFYNSSPTIYNKCTKPLPVMGFNYERNIGEAIHNFGHRAESAIKEVFKGWDGSFTTGWNRFSLHNKDVKGFASCGNTHFTPIANGEYIYDSKEKIRSNCDEFKNYPVINGKYKDITCEAWGCNELGYYNYWWANLPRNKGTNYDEYAKVTVLNNWWLYIFNPEEVKKKR